MESGSLGNLSNQNQKTNLEKHLDFQEVVRPAISEEYYTSAIDFIARMYSTEYYTGKNYKVFPQEFRKYVSDMSVPYNTIFGNGAIKVAVVKCSEGTSGDTPSKKMIEVMHQLMQDVKDEYDFAATYEYNKDKNHRTLDEYIACFPGKVVKNEKGEWVTEEVEGGTAKFFALLVARGAIEEGVILENGMATLGTKGIKFREDFLEELAQLKEKGLEKTIKEPLYQLK